VTAAEVRERPTDDLRREVAALELQIWRTRFQKGSEKTADPSRIRLLRRDVARMLTVLRERELGLERGAKR
jgi:large subunit ribosomal protein L29